MLYPLPVKKITEALTWDQGNTCSLVHGDVGVTDKVGYSPMRAQKQMCVAAALWFVSQTTLLLWLVWFASTVPHSFIPLWENIPVLHHILTFPSTLSAW